jgi:23S rRNA-/tRNA-specific pseudouridylate synthase
VLTKFEFQVEEKFRKSRLDYFLTNKLTNISKIYLRELFKEGKCQINGFEANSGILLKLNLNIQTKDALNQNTFRLK